MQPHFVFQPIAQAGRRWHAPCCQVAVNFVVSAALAARQRLFQVSIIYKLCKLFSHILPFYNRFGNQLYLGRLRLRHRLLHRLVHHMVLRFQQLLFGFCCRLCLAENINAIVIHILAQHLVQVPRRAAHRLRPGNDLLCIAGCNTGQPTGQPAAIQDDGIHLSKHRFVAAVLLAIACLDGAAGICQHINDHFHRVQLFGRNLRAQLIHARFHNNFLPQLGAVASKGIGDRCFRCRNIIKGDHAGVIQQRILNRHGGAALLFALFAHRAVDAVQVGLCGGIIHWVNRYHQRKNLLPFFFVHIVIKNNIRLFVNFRLCLFQCQAAEIRPSVGRIRKLFIQHAQVPYQRFPGRFLFQVQALVALAQLVNADGIGGPHQHGVGHIHGGIQGFQLYQVRFQHRIQRDGHARAALINAHFIDPSECFHRGSSVILDPLDGRVGQLLNIFAHLLVQRPAVRVHAGHLDKIINAQLIRGQVRILRLNHRKNMQHQALLAQRQVVARHLYKVIGFANDGLVPAFFKRNDKRIIFFLFTCRHKQGPPISVAVSRVVTHIMLNIIAHPVVQRKNCKFTQGFTAIILCKMQHPRCGLPYILWGLQPGCRLHRVLLCFSVLLFQSSVT